MMSTTNSLPYQGMMLLKRVLIVIGLHVLGVLSIALDPRMRSTVVRLLLSPLKAFTWKKRSSSSPPLCYLDPSLGKHDCVTVNGVQLYYVSAGSHDKPLMLFLHGFPECWYSWRHQLRCEQLRERYHMVAVDLRGYGRSGKPSYFSGAYHRQIVAEDIHHLVQALGYESCVLVGHDFGALIAYTVARYFPESVAKLITLDAPDDDVYTQCFLAKPAQVWKSLYVAFFQLPLVPELTLTLWDYTIVEETFRDDPQGVVNKEMMTDEDIEVFKWNMAVQGCARSALNYYRTLPAALAPLSEFHRIPTPRYDMPTLILFGDRDNYFESEMAGEHESCGKFHDVTTDVIANASHWLQQDVPDIVNRRMLAWLDDKAKKE